MKMNNTSESGGNQWEIEMDDYYTLSLITAFCLCLTWLRSQEIGQVRYKDRSQEALSPLAVDNLQPPVPMRMEPFENSRFLRSPTANGAMVFQEDPNLIL
ncbi:MAG: hypothetical protein HQL78_13425 [Magnetococcales bacterium]|nr:hypothetical protein [Magnetococcales bacterium]